MYRVEPIGRIISPFKEKFATPRQPGLLTSVQSQIILNNNFSKNAVRDLDKFSHLWILFLFSECINKKKKELIKYLHVHIFIHHYKSSFYNTTFSKAHHNVKTFRFKQTKMNCNADLDD